MDPMSDAWTFMKEDKKKSAKSVKKRVKTVQKWGAVNEARHAHRWRTTASYSRS